MAEARYDAIADFYLTGWTDDRPDPATAALLDLVGDVRGQRALDVACGHGRITRQLVRRGADVLGVDISSALISAAEDAERAEPLGARYRCADVAEASWLETAGYDLVTCNFGLSDIDDLDGALGRIGAALRPGGTFVFSILHPCFPGGGGVTGAWPTGGRYWDEGWWVAEGELSTLRRQVGANHRMLSTYLNVLRGHGLVVDEVAEPQPAPDWAPGGRELAARYPVFLVVRCISRDRGRSRGLERTETPTITG